MGKWFWDDGLNPGGNSGRGILFNVRGFARSRFGSEGAGSSLVSGWVSGISSKIAESWESSSRFLFFIGRELTGRIGFSLSMAARSGSGIALIPEAP